MSIFKDEKAQTGTVFRLVVDSIIGFVILLIIFSTITYFEAYRINISLTEFNSIVVSATELPDGTVLSSERALAFAGGTGFNANHLQEITGIGADCFSFQSTIGSIRINESQFDSDSVEITGRTDARVFAKCFPSQYQDDCRIECVISFGREIQ